MREGDRVRVLDTGVIAIVKPAFVGQEGTILYVDTDRDDPWALVDEMPNGHDGNGGCEIRDIPKYPGASAYWIKVDSLEVIE